MSNLTKHPHSEPRPSKDSSSIKDSDTPSTVIKRSSNNLGNFDKGGYIGTGPKPSKPKRKKEV